MISVVSVNKKLRVNFVEKLHIKVMKFPKKRHMRPNLKNLGRDFTLNCIQFLSLVFWGFETRLKFIKFGQWKHIFLINQSFQNYIFETDVEL